MRSLGMAEKWFLLGGVILLIFALGITYGVTQKQEGLQEVQIKKAEVQGELERLKMRLAQDVSPPDLEAMSRAVPRDWQLPHVLADITLALERHQLTLHSLTVEEPEVEEGLREDGFGEERGEEEGLEEVGVAEEEDGAATADVSYGPQPPAALPDIRSLSLVLEVAGPVRGVLALLDELYQWQRLVWLTGLELAAEEEDEPPLLRIYMKVYAGAPWEARDGQQAWPFSLKPANNGKAFGFP